MNNCPNCGLIKGLHASILPGCMCALKPQNTFRPDWDEKATLVEEMQRMAKRIEELEAQSEQESVATIQTREAFEAWFIEKGDGMISKAVTGGYEWVAASAAWDVWQAATLSERARCEVILANNVSVVEVRRQIRSKA